MPISTGSLRRPSVVPSIPLMNIPDVTPDLPPATWRALLALLRRLPQGALSRGLGRIADTPLPRALRRPVLRAFARAFGIDMEEAELPLEEYGSINAFFVRRLRPGVRSWPADPTVFTSPVDGFVGQAGRIRGGRMLQAKGRDYSAADLLGDADAAARYDGGVFVTLYLSPRHYHRIHAPCAGTIPRATHVPGALLPVNAAAVSHVDNLFPRNERLICYLDGDLGRVAVVAVGAYNVGRISAAFDREWTGGTARAWITNRGRAGAAETREYAPAPRVARGDEIMAFHLGSTVVLLVEPGRLELLPGAAPGIETHVGGALGHRKA